jgi:hypothetical protein
MKKDLHQLIMRFAKLIMGFAPFHFNRKKDILSIKKLETHNLFFF